MLGNEKRGEMYKINLRDQFKELTMPEIQFLHIPEELLRLGMDGEDVSWGGELGFGGDPEPWRL